MKNKHSIAFIFIDEIHHIFHFVTVAVELSKTNEVDILTFPGKHNFLRSSLAKLGGEQVKVIELKTYFFRTFTDWIKKRSIPRKGFWMKKNANFILHKYDALIFTDYTHHKLLKYRNIYGSKTKFLKFPHGAPGRSYSYNQELLDFDFQLIFGDFQYNQYKKKNLLGDYPIKAGYPKKNAVDKLTKSNLIFSNGRPVVIYNPHFSKPLSSWYTWGYDILDFFLKQDKFNLIFAPHINLFNKTGFENRKDFPEIYKQSKHIHIDLGSDKSVDMTYILQANIYLGDVSSQVYEFVLQPRPCLFLNPTKESYKNKLEFRFWQMGNVIESLPELDNNLNSIENHFRTYRPIQEKINKENFYTEEKSTASEIAAREINSFLSS